MKQYPEIPSVEDAPDDLFDGGHLWLLELVDGEQLRFQLQESGVVRFGDRRQAYSDPAKLPERFQHAVRHVREHLDRQALRSAVDSVEDVTFFGESMHRQSVEYDWPQTPSFLGFDVWSEPDSSFRPPDAVEGIFEGLGLQSVNVFEREQRARDFDPASYSIPDSRWYDGPAAGVVIRNKTGMRAKMCHSAMGEDEETTPLDSSTEAVVAVLGDEWVGGTGEGLGEEWGKELGEELAGDLATEQRIGRIADQLPTPESQITFETLYDRVLEAIMREQHTVLSNEAVDMKEFRSEVAARTRAYLDS